MTLVEHAAQDYRHGRIMHQAARAFLTDGYTGTSVEAIANRAGVSKVTIYALYGDKLELAIATLNYMAESLKLVLDKSIIDDLPPRECLESLGLAYVRWMNRPIGDSHNYDTSRLVMEIFAYNPEGVRYWSEITKDFGARKLEKYLKGRMESGDIGGEDPYFLACHFFLMICGPGHMVIANRLWDNMLNKEIEGTIRRKVRLFLNGCSVPSTDKPA